MPPNMADTRGGIISFHPLCVTVLLHYTAITSVLAVKPLPILPANNLAVLGDCSARRRILNYFSIYPPIPRSAYIKEG